ncbi:hypothetical protein M3Y94_00843800 [Aphelenchoides besseyi]|nr:hypothetical protein M3Y94_00843800 [Aphelenchoides besseyi]KAI6226897.1 hypothetical protein M3Y95_00669800 [Aphelenchoides besseyi]
MDIAAQLDKLIDGMLEDAEDVLLNVPAERETLQRSGKFNRKHVQQWFPPSPIVQTAVRRKSSALLAHHRRSLTPNSALNVGASESEKKKTKKLLHPESKDQTAKSKKPTNYVSPTISVELTNSFSDSSKKTGRICRGCGKPSASKNRDVVLRFPFHEEERTVLKPTDEIYEEIRSNKLLVIRQLVPGEERDLPSMVESHKKDKKKMSKSHHH